MLTLLLIIMLLAPLIAVVICLLTTKPKVAEYSNLLASIITLAAVLPLPWLSLQGPYFYLDHYVLLDALNAWVLLCVALVFLLASIYAIGYMRMHRQDQPLPRFYALFAAFALVMLLAPLMNNIGIYWIAIELTTLVSTFLIGFESSTESIEAAWKYIILVSAGISLALLGIIIFYWGGTFVLGPTYDLTWPTLKQIAPQINPTLLFFAFLLVLVGFGTKVGLAPLHTWLPDAHSEGPAPVSAMLSGALLNTAMLGIARFSNIMKETTLGKISGTALVILGICSLTIAALFIVRQRGIKRLLAYSSIEHMGILALGFGFGGPFGIAGALYHMLNHSLNKSLMFFGAGNAIHVYHSKEINKIQRVLSLLPFSGLLWLAGAVAITGAPPFGLFLSEITILRAGLAGPNAWAVFVMAILLIVIFGGFMNHFRQMYVGAPPEHALPTASLSKWCLVPMVIAFIPLLVFGVWWPQSLWHYFTQVGAQLGVTPG